MVEAATGCKRLVHIYSTNCYCYLERGEDSKAKTDNQRQWKQENKKMKKYMKSQGKKGNMQEWNDNEKD